MGVGAGLYMYDVVVKSSRSLSHLLMSSRLACCKMAGSAYARHCVEMLQCNTRQKITQSSPIKRTHRTHIKFAIFNIA